MAEEIVVKEPLWPEMVDAGKKLTQQLDADGFDVRASLWFYFVDGSQWRLLIASPLVDEKGPKETYERIRASLGKDTEGLAGLSLQNISVVSPSDPAIRVLGKMFHLPGFSSVRMSRSRLNNLYVEDVYIYRMNV